MKLTVFLFKSDAKAMDQLLDPHKRVKQVGLLTSMPRCRAWTSSPPPSPPDWAGVVAPLVDVSELRNKSNSLVLLLEVDERFFAITFGYAQHLLQDTLLEHDFGLRVTANVTDPRQLSIIQSRTVEANSRQQRSQTTHRSSVHDFDIELEREWLRYLKGDVEKYVLDEDSEAEADIAKSIGGSQSVLIHTKKAITDLPEILHWLLESFKSNAYKQKYPYIDNLTPVPKGDPALTPLRVQLQQAIVNPQQYHIGVASPDDLMGAEVEYYKIRGDGVRRRGNLEELSSDQILGIIAGCRKGEPLETLKITPYDAGDNPLRPTKRIRDYIVFETDLDGGKYVLCLGQWFKIAADYVAEIDQTIAQVEDLTEELSLPIWPIGAGIDEGDYNEKVADKQGWLCMDKNLIYRIGGPHQKIEVCDLLTEDFNFICTKRMDSSATLSHLFSQASVSAELYQENPEGYADLVREQWQSKWPGLAASTTPRMTLAIATERSGRLADELYFFSKVNLSKRLRDIRNSGFRVALAKIPRQ